MRNLFFLVISIILWTNLAVAALPVINFSDINSGPKTGNTDGVGSGAIVTIWGNNLGATQGTSKVYVGSTEATTVYYWKNANGQLPGGPADLYTSHKMQEVCFSIPYDATDGANTIKVVVGGANSNTLPFSVRSGNIYFIKNTGNDTTGNGSWSSPWATLQSVVNGNNGKISAGDIIYSVGVGSASNVNVGYAAGLVGTLAMPFSLITYPNTYVAITGTDHNIRNFNALSKYWHFSKLTLTTTYEAFSLFGHSRVAGNKITGPSVGAGYSGFIGGNCSDTGGDTTLCSGYKILGNEVCDYGNASEANAYQHLMYISNRSGELAAAYEVAWNNFHDNPVYHGIHIFDQSPYGGWTGTFKIHHNYLKNIGGSAINLMFEDSGTGNNYDVFSNVIVTDPDFSPGGYAEPLYPIRMQSTASTFKIYNNTIYGYRNGISPFQGNTDVRNNIIIDREGISYASNTPTTDSSNLFYSLVNGNTLPLPSWATGELNVDPEFISAASGDFRPAYTSDACSNGADTTSIVQYDFLSSAVATPMDIGAFECLNLSGKQSIGTGKYSSGTGKFIQ